MTLTLTDLINPIYAAMEVVSREMVGFVPAVARDSSAERAAVGQVVTSPVVGPMAAEDLSPAAFAAAAPAQTIGNVQMTISRERSVPFSASGEESMGLNNAGTLGGINQQRIEQALRTLTNEVETDLASTHTEASRAVGTYNVVPFATAGDFMDFADANMMLDDNGAPLSDRHLVLGSKAVGNIRGKQSGLFRANEAGTDELLRRGIIGNVESLDVHNSAQVAKNVAVGTASGATTDTTGYAVGSTALALASAGTGTILAGDIVTFVGDATQYVVATGNADVSAGGAIVLAEPGLMQAIPASAVVISVVGAATRNMFFHRSAIQLATRAPAMPDGGDSARDVMMVTDPISGITFEFCVYPQKRQLRYEVNLAWGWKVIAPRHCGLLIGA